MNPPGTIDPPPTLADTLWPLLEDRLFGRTGDDQTFNPWRDRDARLCVPDAAERRRANLRRYLESFPGGPDAHPPALLVGEAPSWRGCRFSGIAFTAEALLLDPGFPIRGERTNAFRDAPLSEASATIVWGRLRPHFPRFFLWNALPLHPHPREKPLANRTPGAREVAEYRDLLEAVVAAVEPEHVLAVGRTAERSLTAAGIAHRYVRHPSHGGARAFGEGVGRALGV